jgi:hypothetical protein
MTRQRKSPVLETAQRRINGLKYLNPSLDLGKGLSLEQFAALADELDAKLTDYNDTVASLDSKRSGIEALEERLRKLSERMLTTTASLYGRDSDEYEMVGGVKRVSRKSTAAPKSTNSSPIAAMAPSLIVNTPATEIKNGSKNGKGEVAVN